MPKIFCVSDIHGHLTQLEEALGRIRTKAAEGDRLIFLGDYIDNGPDSGGVLRRLFELQKTYGPQRVIVLRGNHEEMLLEWLRIFSGPSEYRQDEYGWPLWSGWLEADPELQTFRTLVSQSQWDFFQQVTPTLGEESLNVTAAKMVLEHDRELIRWLWELPYYYETERQIFVHAGVDEEAGENWSIASPERTFVWKFPASRGPFLKDVIAGHLSTATLSGDRDFHDVYWDGASHYYIDGTVYVSKRLPVLVYDMQTGKYSSLDGDIKSAHTWTQEV